MNGIEWRQIGERLLWEVADVRQAYPDAAAMGRVAVGPEELPAAAGRFARLRAAIGHLRDELRLVRAGGAGTLGVLDDEVDNVLRELADARAVTTR